LLQVMKQIPWLWKLNRLVTSIGFCLVPMMQAYGILLVVTLVYAVLGVHLFGNQVPEYFADLQTALMTLHQAVTGDSWGSGVTRSLFPVQANGQVAETDASVALFFISYMLIGNVLLLNVVVAVLLDGTSRSNSSASRGSSSSNPPQRALRWFQESPLDFDGARLTDGRRVACVME